MNYNYNKFLVPDLRLLLETIGQPSNGVKESLLKRLKDFGEIPEIPLLGHKDTYEDWETGGGWIKVMIYNVINEISPEFTYERSKCICDESDYGICRCTRLENIQINEEDPKWSYEWVKMCSERLVGDAHMANGQMEVSDIGAYIIFRTLTMLVRDCIKNGTIESLVEAYGNAGYYGEELETRSYIRESLYQRLKSGINLKELLKWEYGGDMYNNVIYVDVVEVDPKKIIISNEGHFQKCMKEDIYYWYRGIVGICTNINGKYTLKDGYHRLASAYNRQQMVKVIVAIFE
jgi:hypothetical protein